MPVSVLGASFDAVFFSLSNGGAYFAHGVLLGGSIDNVPLMATCLGEIELVLRSLDVLF